MLINPKLKATFFLVVGKSLGNKNFLEAEKLLSLLTSNANFSEPFLVLIP